MEKQIDNRIFTPELLAPAGSYESLCAAIEAGADAVYMGGEHNARAFARNFDRESMREALALCRAYGVKSYITLNTLVYEREMREWLEYARYLWECGADAFIVADLGAAVALREYIPEVRLHASTQMSVHNCEGVRLLSSLGFERVVVARELSGEDIRAVVENTGCEIEAFVHGALCVSTSGQCLFSSLVGGRSGNRGECAQPCRLEYNGAPVLSLRDNCLASHIREICDIGVHSLKIEGRMKSPEYVYGTVSIYRRLLDERRNATDAEIREMSQLFSRSGFTDGYFISDTDGMCGVRTAADKQSSASMDAFDGLKIKIPIDIECIIKAGLPAALTVRAAQREATVTGSVPSAAVSAPIDDATVFRAMSKLGATPYEARRVDITLDGGLFMRASELNALRREAIEALAALPSRSCEYGDIDLILKKKNNNNTHPIPSARFISQRQLERSGVTLSEIPRLFLPLCEYNESTQANGVIIPPLVYECEWQKMREQLQQARALGCEWAMCTNISHLPLARELGFRIMADFRLNVTNPVSARVLCELGAEDVLLSAELKCAALRDIDSRKSVIIYGRIPLMLCEKCVVRECGACSECREGRPYYLVDRTGARFPIFRERPHRSVIYNSAITYMADRKKDLAAIGRFSPHYIFSDETPETVGRVLDAYREGTEFSGVFSGELRFRRL